MRSIRLPTKCCCGAFYRPAWRGGYPALIVGPATIVESHSHDRKGRVPRFSALTETGFFWFVTREGRVTRFIDGQFADVPISAGLTNRVTTLALDSRQRIWAGAQNEIALWNGSPIRGYDADE